MNYELEKLKYLSLRQAFADALLELGEKNKKIIALTADLGESTKILEFGKKYPERYFDFGVAEADMVGAAAGLALEGFIPFVSTYAIFCPGRCLDQIRQSICYNQANVKLVSTHAGLSVGPDGATHQSLEDIAIMRTLPNMTVLVPCDYNETKKAVLAAAKINGPVYIRLPRTDQMDLIKKSDQFAMGQANILRTGKEATIIACGPMVYQSLLAADELLKQGIKVGVINLSTIKPIDKNAIIKAAKTTCKILTVEDHQIFGGLGSAVAEVLAQNYPVKMKIMGMNDQFGQSGSPEELYKFYKLDKDSIKKEVLKLIGFKKAAKAALKISNFFPKNF